jgi:hypothetical protein
MPSTSYQSGPMLMGNPEKAQLSVTTISSIDIASQFQHNDYSFTGPDLYLWPTPGLLSFHAVKTAVVTFMTTHLAQDHRARYNNSTEFTMQPASNFTEMARMSVHFPTMLLRFPGYYNTKLGITYGPD